MDAAGGSDDSSSISSSTKSGGEAEEVEVVEEVETTDLITYTESDLELLIEKVKNFTTLFDLREDDWSEAVIEVVKNYFEDPKEQVLCIFFDKKILDASLGFPTIPVADLTYFLKDSNVTSITPQNFHEAVMFGTTDDKIEGTVLNVIQYIYGPVFFNETSWPPSVKTDLCGSLHEFLANLTDLHYKLLGLTVIYIPQEGLNLSAEEASTDPELVKRLEAVCVHWTRQVKVALGDQEQSNSKELLTPADEYDFWVYRYQNLAGLDYQLQNKSLKHVTEILVMSQSTYIKQFLDLYKEIQDAMKVAKSNIEFLQILREPCAEIQSMSSPTQIPAAIPKLLQLVRVIWMNSPYYNTREKLTNLCKAISNLIILQCTKAVNLEFVFQGNTKAGIKLFEDIIECCLKYKVIYEKIAEAHTIHSDVEWALDNGAIFNYVDSFIQRCRDMIEVCEAMIIFGRKDETEKIDKPLFRGTRGEEFERTVDRVEDNFMEYLDSIHNVKDTILNVQSPSWYESILNFRKQMKELEVIMENLITEVFSQVANVEEGLYALQAFYHYAKRDAIRPVFDKKTNEVYKLFSDEVQSTKDDIMEEKKIHPAGLPTYSGRAMLLNLKRKRLQQLRKILDDARWLPHCGMGDESRLQFEKVMKTINDTMKEYYRNWLGTLEDNMNAKLQRTLLCRSTSRPGFLECNFDRSVLTACEEARVWERLKFEAPSNMQALYKNWNALKLLYNKVVGVVLDYNNILESLSTDERVLFRELIRVCDKKVAPGLSKLQWNSDVADQYIADCSMYTGDLQEFIDDFKNANLEMVLLCEKICDTPMIAVTPGHVYLLSELEDSLEDFKEETLAELQKIYEKIIIYMLVVHEGFADHIEDMGIHWHNYVHKMDSILEEALIQCVNTSVQVMREILHGDDTSGPTPFIKICVTLKGTKITFEPQIYEVGSLIEYTLQRMVEAIENFPRLFKKFNVPSMDKEDFAKVVETNQGCLAIQQEINHEFETQVSHIQTYLQTWKPFKEMWELDKDMFVKRFENLQPTVASFDSNIARYTEVANNVHMIESIADVYFLIVDAAQLKHAITDHCYIWQSKLTDLMYRVTYRNIKTEYEYMKTNGDKLRHVPQTLHELQESIKHHELMVKEVPDREKEFPVIKELFSVLQKYEYQCEPEMLALLKGMDEEWKAFLRLIDDTEQRLGRDKERFRAGLLDQKEKFKTEAANLLTKFLNEGPFGSDWSTKDALANLRAIRAKLTEMRGQEAELRENLSIFGISIPDNADLDKLEEELSSLELVWQLTDEWDQAWESYKSGGFWTTETQEMEDTAQTLYRKLTRLSRELKDKNWSIVEHTRSRVDAFRRTLPLIGDLKNPAMRDRHWERVKVVINRTFDQHSPDFTLEAIMNMNMQAHAEDINDISNAATMELAIENGLKAITQTWKELKLELIPHRAGIYRIKVADEITQALEENLVQIGIMKSTKFVEPFIKEVDYWEKGLTVVTEVLDVALVVQRQFLYLENIFLGEDIRKQMPEETEIFENLTSEWRNITSQMNKDNNAFRATHFGNIWKDLNRLNDTLEAIQRALESYLETKRHIFPRFYFISNDDLLEVLAQSKKPENVQPHLKKCFDNINRLNMQKNALTHKTEALGMFSSDGEYIDFTAPILLEGPVELWLCLVETAMRVSLREQLKATRLALRKNLTQRDKWIKEWPGQMCITSSQIQWTTDCTRALIRCKIMEIKKPLKKLKRKENKVLDKYSDAVRGSLTKIQRLKVVALVTIEIHARDVVEKMYKQNCMDVMAFDWLSQLRFYWDKEKDDCVVRQTDTLFNYSYEYLGNSGRLVITPLTDRCYITLTMALNLHRGGSPKGPAGTGKTETVKDLGKALGSYVIVVNCSEGLDYKSMGRMFSGLAQTGAWGCFDEFNRINIEVLSVVAQQILCVLSALAAELERFVFEDAEINLKDTCGIFITMNPGYAGRTELPDNLKSMFRPISMVVPDSCLIAEIILFGEGFHDTRILAKKVFTLYSLATQQLSKQDHYDFGLRALVSVLRYAGRIRREHSDLPDEEVVLLAMRDMNIAKLTADDLPLFTGVIGDLFPGVTVAEIEYDVLGSAIRKYFENKALQCTASAYLKVIQLYETKNSRHSVMIVGATGSGKSTTWRALQGASTQLEKDKAEGWNIVRDYPMNPKAVTLAELYGEFNLTTNEWLDGILSSIMRNTCSEETPDLKWIIFDGPVDAVWIENMNSVMDDNKILTLINSERITMPDQVSLLFEVEDLAVASPATVSRCGMVYNDYKDLGWRPYVDSWLNKQADKGPTFLEEVGEMFTRHVNAVLDFKRANCQELITIPELNSVISLCKLFDCLATKENGVDPADEEHFSGMVKMWFLFCLVWSICAAVDEEGRKKMDAFIREREGVYPLKETVYEYYVDIKTKAFMLWEGKLSDSWRYNKDDPFYKIIVPTVDTMRYEFLIGKLLENNFSGLLIGPVGTGKTSTAQTVLESLDEAKYSVLEIHMSAQTSSKNVQDSIEGRVEKRTKGVYGPPGGKTMITFMEDLNMPAKETFGAQPPLELVRQWIDYGFWYNREKQTRTYIKNMLVMAAMGPPGGGRTQISNRLLSRFNVINLTFPSEGTITRIFSTLLNIHLADFHDEIKVVGRSLTAATINLYFAVIANMLPTPTKMHYLFNLRDISKIFQGILRSHPDYQTTGTSMLRLWIHECYRVFNDRLIDEKDEQWFLDQMNIQLGKFYDVTFHSLCPGNDVPIFGDFVNPYGMYEDLDDIVKLRKYLEEQMEEYNASPGVVRMNLVLFKDAIQHICRVVRVVSQPRGNMLLIGIGGSGRQSLSRIASYICEYQVFQIEVKKNYGVPEFKEDLKVLYKLTGLQLRATAFVFSDVQVTDEAFLEIINNILSSGEVANLYKPEEFEEVRNALMKDMNKAGITPSNENVQRFLIERVRSKLHVILCLSPIGDAFRDRIRQYPSFVNCTTIDWFKDWPKEALLEVASRYISDMDFLKTILPVKEEEELRDWELAEKQESLRTSVAFIFATIHDSVAKYSKRMINEMRRYNYVTPTNYLELVKGYKEMLEEKRTHISDAANKLRNGLFKIEDTKEKVQVMSVELAEAQVQVNQFQKECDEYLVTIVNQRREADEQQTEVAAQSVTIKEEEVVCKKLADVALKDLQQAMPALEEAMRALDALNKKDLAEVKSYGRPPPKVELVMEAVMIFKQVEPTWAEAKRQLGDPNFLITLRDFDRDHIPDRVLKKINVYTTNPEFDPEKVGTVSFAAKSLAMWVIAMEKYGKIYRIIAPKKEKLDQAEAALKEKQDSLAAAQAKLRELSEYLEKLQKQYEDKLNQKEELKRKAELLQQKLERAAQLVDGLSGERERWTQSVSDMNGEYGRLPGDCLLATGFVAYVGPFVSLYREELLKLWKSSVVEQEVPCSEDFDVSNFLSDPTTIREWNIQGLPSDSFSTENGIIVNRATRWPLLIDPQSQGMKWLKNFGKKMKLTVIDFGMTNYMKIMEHAIQFGKAILLQNVSEVLDPSLNPILNKAIVKQGGQTLIKLTDKMVSYNEKFRLFITTKMGNPHYAPEITTKTTLVNFSVKEQGLEAQLLGIVVRKEKPQLEEQKDKLVLDIAASKRKLLDLEDELLRLLYETKGSLLDDLSLLVTLQTSKETSVSVGEQLIVAEKTEKDIDYAREGYRASARRASILFFVLNDMSQIDPMYQFSLDAYISLFILSIAKSPREADLQDRITSLNNYHTYAVYKYSCRGLFENHKLLFSFHMCVKILSAIGKINDAEYLFLLKGGVVLDKETQMDNPCPEWLSEQAWDNITELDRLAGFHGVADTFEQFARDWHLWYINTNPENLPLLGEWNDICTEFQKMLFVRCLRSDRLSFSVTKFIVNNLGAQFVEPPVLDIRAVLEDSTPQTPLIFVLSPGVDPTGALSQLAESRDMTEYYHSLSLGQGQAPVATRMIEIGAKEGHWVFLANCHLSLSWMPKLDKIVDNLQSSKVHKRFRLWLSSSPNPEFPISILQAGIKMTTEPPRGIKANLKRLYKSITDTQFETCTNQSAYKKLLFCLCFFHAVLLERRKFQQLGWNVVYSFNDSDFVISELVLSNYLDEYQEATPWDALKYLIAGINYGGHVTDDWDRRLIITYVNQYFCEDALTVSNFRLSSLPTYYIPRDGSLQSYIDHIQILPTVDQAEAFGQHSNADITSLISETRILCETLMSLQMQSSSAEGQSKEDKVLQLASEVASKVPSPIDYAHTEKLIGAEKTPLDVVLLQEISRYNQLLTSMDSSLEELQKAIKGFVVMSSELEEIFTCIFEGRVPSAWLRAYSSMKLLGSWTRDLVLRVQHFSAWAETTHAPLFFWLSAFTFPTGFLTAVLQTEARRLGVSVDTLSWDFTVFTTEKPTVMLPPKEGVYVRGLFLEGAAWDVKNACLIEPQPMQLVVSIPVIHFKPMEVLKKKMRGIYVCPCYYFPQRCGDQGRPAYIVAVDLKSGSESPDFWVKRGTAILLSLAN